MGVFERIAKFTGRSGEGLLDGLLSIVVIVLGIYLAFWVFGIVFRVIVLLVVAGVVVYLFFLFVDWVKKLDGG